MAVGVDDIALIILIVLLIISVVFGIYPVITQVARNKCIVQQHTLLNAFDKIIELVKEKGAPIKNHSFLVMGCTDCIWYDSLNSQWVIKHRDEEQINKSISYNVLGVAANCFTCNDPSLMGVKCANMVKDTTYNFEIGEDYVKCTNCPDSPNLCDYQILFDPRVLVVNEPVEQRPIELVSYKNNLYLFYNKKGMNEIYYKTSTDGKNWNPEVILTDSAHIYGFPSAYVFNDDLYVAYSGKIGDFQIFIRKFDGTSWGSAVQLTSSDINYRPYLAAYMGKLYIFYSHSDSIDINIKYRICDNNCDISGNWGSEKEAM